MNKYLEKIAAKLPPEYKQDIRQSVSDIRGLAKSTPISGQLRQKVTGELLHDVSRDLSGHKYNDYKKSKPLYDRVSYINSKRIHKDSMSKIPVSQRPVALRMNAITGRILRRGK